MARLGCSTAEEHRHEVVESFGRMLPAYDADLWDHSDVVADLGLLVAAEIDFDHPDRLLVADAGVVHDLGKLGVPRSILDKPGPLTVEERRAVERHPAIGADMLLAISPHLTALAEAVHSHHERWDGSGYPDQLAGEEIPRAGRVLAVVDVYSALTQQRSYRSKVFSPGEARAFLEEHAGSHFDPQCVEATVGVLQARRIRRRHFSS